jgi:hypothetical protein
MNESTERALRHRSEQSKAMSIKYRRMSKNSSGELHEVYNQIANLYLVIKDLNDTVIRYKKAYE